MKKLIRDKPWILVLALMAAFIVSDIILATVAFKNPPVRIETTP